MSNPAVVEEFRDKVVRAWALPNSSRLILRHTLDAAILLGVGGEDHRSQVDVAGELGIIVGECWSGGVDDFFDRFAAWVNEQQQ